jgi:hypothetical protein
LSSTLAFSASDNDKEERHFHLLQKKRENRFWISHTCIYCMLFVRAHLSSSPNDKLKDLYVSLIPIESSSSSIGSTRVYKIDKISSVFMVFDKIGLILFRFLNPRSVLDTCCSSTDRADASERCMMVRWAAGPALHRRRCACLANQQ